MFSSVLKVDTINRGLSRRAQARSLALGKETYEKLVIDRGVTLPHLRRGRKKQEAEEIEAVEEDHEEGEE